MKLQELKILLADDDADDCLFFKEAVTSFIPASSIFSSCNFMRLVCILIYRSKIYFRQP